MPAPLDTELANSAVEIVSITTGRESLLIGPASAFGSNTRELVLRDRPRIQGILIDFLSRQGASDQLRPHLRRWGLSQAHSALNEREWMREALLKAISSGQLLITIAPDVTRGFSVPHAVIVRKTTSAAKAQALQEQPHLPVDLEDRLIIVMQMVPDYMSGSTKAAFLETIENVGIGMIVGGLIAWIGAHFIPGVNLAVLAFDLFFLGSDVLKACETIAATLDDIRKARNRQDLEPAAKAIAGAIAVLVVAGIFNRILRAKSVTKAASKKTRHAIDEKPNMGEGSKPKREKQRPRDDGGDSTTNSGSDKPLKASIRETMHNNVKNRKKGQRPPPETYIPKNEIDAHLAKFDDGASRIMLKKNLDKYGPGQKDGTSFVMPKEEADRLIASAGGDKRKLEDALGLPKGTLDDNELVRVDIPEPRKLNVRMPSGNEAGANDLWLPGGKLPGGNHEAVIDVGAAPPGSFVETPLKL